MNPASRIYDLLKELHKRIKLNTRLIDIYKEIFKTDSIYEIYEILHIYQQNLHVIENEIDAIGRYSNYERILKSVHKFILPLNLESYISSFQNDLNDLELSFMILSDSFSNKKYQENDIQDSLDIFDSEIDKFLDSIMSLELDDETKKIMILVMHKIKKSIKNYKYRGIIGLSEDFYLFKCILEKTQESKSILDKLLTVVKKAKDVKETTAFISENIDYAIDFVIALEQ